MSTYGWIITKDLLATGEPGDSPAVGLTGPSSVTVETLAALQAGEGARFRMVDADNIIYFEGRLVGDAESEDGFGPLDDFGYPGCGCTSIEYWSEQLQQWEVL